MRIHICAETEVNINPVTMFLNHWGEKRNTEVEKTTLSVWPVSQTQTLITPDKYTGLLLTLQVGLVFRLNLPMTFSNKLGWIFFSKLK